VKFLDRQPDQAAAAIAAFFLRPGGARRVVAARAEGAVAGAGQHDDADVAVVLRIAHRLQHLSTVSARNAFSTFGGLIVIVATRRRACRRGCLS